MTYTLEMRPSPNQTYDPARAAPDGIVIHHWGADGQTHDDVVTYLCRGGGNSSAHYVASAGRVTCLVDPIDTAWHAGSWPINYKTIGIECRPEMSAGDWQTVAEVIAYLRSRFGALPLTGHKDHYPTACPGRWYPRLAALSAAADAIRAGHPINDEGDNELNTDQAKKLDNLSWLMSNSVTPALARLDKARVATASQLTALTAAVQALASSQGLDPATITRTVDQAVKDALADLTITLTTEETK